ncbi:DUF192 domain-containing protein [Salinisphaera sp.]|uniref:DUF192 domain-containing protein n=1 Tax=Salinisphaera sp. TaxID=1914330 RepID=UPI002D78B0B2|nr:DUF192 domain-containing protein [Salinisphaera sp.]
MAFEKGRIESEDGRVLFAAATRPLGFWARARGLLGRKALADDQAWWFEPCGAVHTLGMRVAIDIVHLDRAGRVLRIRRQAGPASVSWAPGGRCVIETGAGNAVRAGIRAGQVLRFVV